jgi:hypothetical protein
LLVGRYPPACCSSRLPVLLLRLLQKVNGAQCQQLSLAVLLAWLEPSYHFGFYQRLTPQALVFCRPSPLGLTPLGLPSAQLPQRGYACLVRRSKL